MLLLFAQSIRQLRDVPRALPRVQCYDAALAFVVFLGERKRPFSRKGISKALCALATYLKSLVAHLSRLSRLIVIVLIRHDGAPDPLELEPIMPALESLPRIRRNEQLDECSLALTCCAYDGVGVKRATLAAEWDGQRVTDFDPDDEVMRVSDIFDDVDEDVCVGV